MAQQFNFFISQTEGHSAGQEPELGNVGIEALNLLTKKGVVDSFSIKKARIYTDGLTRTFVARLELVDGVEVEQARELIIDEVPGIFFNCGL